MSGRYGQHEVSGAVGRRLAARQAPGVVGVATRAEVLREHGEVWTAAQLELWRDTELAWLNRALPAGPPADADAAARTALALADTRVRDVVLARTLAAQLRQPVAAALAPLPGVLPERWRAPAGTVLATLEWVGGQDPRPLLDIADPARGYSLAERLREVLADERPGEGRRWAGRIAAVPPEDLRHGMGDRSRAAALERQPDLVLGSALARAGWALQVTGSGGTDAGGAWIGYLLHDHDPVAVVECLAAPGEITAAFPGPTAAEAAWRQAVANAGVGAADAVAALAGSAALDLLHPPAAGRVASSPAVLLATDRIIARPGPSRGPRLH